jgi:hypothetical protein
VVCSFDDADGSAVSCLLVQASSPTWACDGSLVTPDLSGPMDRRDTDSGCNGYIVLAVHVTVCDKAATLLGNPPGMYPELENHAHDHLTCA